MKSKKKKILAFVSDDIQKISKNATSVEAFLLMAQRNGDPQKLSGPTRPEVELRNESR